MKRSNGEGTIYKRKDGRWCAAYYDEEPIPKRHFVYGKTQAEVKKKLKEKRDNPDIETGKNEKFTLESWIAYYLENFKKNEIKKTTYGTYFETYRKHIKGAAIGRIKLKALKTEQLQQFYNEKLQDGYSAKTVRHMHVIINSALEYAFKMRYVKENVNRFVILPKRETYVAKTLYAKEVSRIVNEAKEDELYPIVVLCIYTGLRKGEIMALKWEDVDFERKELTVKASLCRVRKSTSKSGVTMYGYEILDPKTIKSKRVVPLMDKAVEALLLQKDRQEQMKEKYKLLYEDNGYVFAGKDGSYLKQRQFMDKYHDFLKKYDVSDVRFHDLRHTFASLLLEAGESPKIIQELLGHTTITTTMDIYTHVSPKAKIQAIKTLDGVVKLSEKGSEDNDEK